MSVRITASIATALLLFQFSMGAKADVLPPPPKNCPAGSIGKSGNEGSWCEPTTCASTADCKSTSAWDYSLSNREQEVTYSCEPAGVCVHEEELIQRQKIWPPKDGKLEFKEAGRRKQKVASKACSADKDCDAKEKCETASRCLEATRRFKDDGGVVYFFKPQAKNIPAQIIPAPSAVSSASTTPPLDAGTPVGGADEPKKTVSGDRCACDLIASPVIGGSVSALGFGLAAIVAFRRRARR